MRTRITIPKEEVDTSKFIDIPVFCGKIPNELEPPKQIKCFPGAWYHKVVSSKDSWVGVEAKLKLGEFTPDEKRFNLDGLGRFMDNHNVYLGGLAETEADCGLGYNTMYESDNTSYELTKASPKLGYRPFYRFIVKERYEEGGNVDVINANFWRTSDPRDLCYYYFPGDIVRIKVYSPIPNYLQMRIELVEPSKIKKYQEIRKRYHLENDLPKDYISPLFYSSNQGVTSAEFKRVNSIDQYGNEGFKAINNTSKVENEVWYECYLYRYLKGELVKVPFNQKRQCVGNFPNSKSIKVIPLNHVLGAEEVNIIPKGEDDDN